MITNYIPDTCKYSVNNLKKVVHIFSSASNKVYIDNGEAYVTGGITDLQTISATSVTFEENTSYDDRFKFQKTVTVTVDGFLKLDSLNEKYYVVLEDENKVKWLVNVDFPSLVTYTYTLADGTDETVFTFSALSNFPTLKLNASINNAYACQNYSLVKVENLKMLEKKYANIDAQSDIIYGYSNQVYKTVKPYRNSIKAEETFDGTNANTTIQFSIGLDDYQSSWHYNMLEYPYNKYVVVIDHLACGFEMGLVSSYNVQGSHQIGSSDIVTIKLVGTSQRGSEWANSWTEVTVAPAYTWKLSKEWICVTPPSLKFILTLSDLPTVSAECDSTSAITYNEMRQYSATVITAEIGTCITGTGNYAFANCSGLTSVTMSDNFTSLGQFTFSACTSLSRVTLSNNLTTITWGAFIRCYNLANIIIPDNVTSIAEHAFNSCSGLTSINIPSGVTSIGQRAFYNCYSLTSVTIPSGVTSFGGYVFENCTGLTSVTVLPTTPPTLGRDVFYNTNNCPIYVLASAVNTYKTAENWSDYASRIQPIP